MSGKFSLMLIIVNNSSVLRENMFKLLILFVLLFLSFLARSEVQTFFNEDKSIVIIQTCQDAECQIDYQNLKHKRNIISGVREELISVSWLNRQQIANVHINCGSYCTGDFYIKRNGDVTSFPNVLALDEQNECIFYGKDLSHLAFQKMFAKKPTKIINIKTPKYKFANYSAISMLAETDIRYFGVNKTFRMTYLDSKGLEKILFFRNPCNI